LMLSRLGYQTKETPYTPKAHTAWVLRLGVYVATSGDVRD